MELKRALEVAGLVLVHDVVLGELVEHRGYLRQKGLGGALLGGVAQGLHGIAGRLVVETVVRTLRQGLTDTLLRRLMVCHNLNFCCSSFVLRSSAETGGFRPAPHAVGTFPTPLSGFTFHRRAPDAGGTQRP